ncbi:MAG: phage tail length tape measure family protein [Acidobacteriota bacterium]
MTESALLEKIYVEVEARLGTLEKQLDQASDKGRKAAKGIEDVFTKGQLKFNDSLAKKSIAEIEQSAIRLRAHLEKRIEMGAPLYQLEALKNSLDKAENAVSTFKNKTDEIPPSLDKVNKSAGGLFGSLGGLMKGLGGIVAGYQIFDFLKDSVEESKQAAQSFAKVEQAIKTTGGAAGYTAEQLSKMATELETLSGIDGDQIMNDVTAQLLTFTNISGTQFQRAQKAALDLAAVIGTDLKSQTIQLGKALEDPVTGMTALRRAGVTFTEAQQEQIKSLIASNDLFGAQSIILTEIETKYGGQAEAANKASGGTMTLAVAWGNLKEQLGNTVMPVLTALAGSLTTISNKTKETTEFWLVLGGVFKVVGTILIALKTGIIEIGYALGTLGAGLVALTQGKFKLVQDIFSQGWKKMFNEWKDYDSSFQNMWSSSTGSAKEQAAEIARIQKLVNDTLKNQAITDPKQESEIEKIIGRESELKKTLDEVNKALTNGNLSQFARNELIAKQIELTKELAKYNRIINPDLEDPNAKGFQTLDTYGTLGKNTRNRDKVANPYANGKISGVPKELQKLPELQKPGVAIGETTSQLERQLALSNAISESFNGTINTITSTWGNAISSWISSGKSFAEATTYTWRNMTAQILGMLAEIGVKYLLLTGAKAIFNNATSGFGGFLINALGGGNAHNGGVFANGVKLAAGGGGIVPPGFPNDSFRLNVQSDELVKVYTPRQQVDNMRDYSSFVSGISRVETALQILNSNMMDETTRGRKDSLKIGIEGRLDGNDLYLLNKKTEKTRKRFE